MLPSIDDPSLTAIKLDNLTLELVWATRGGNHRLLVDEIQDSIAPERHFQLREEILLPKRKGIHVFLKVSGMCGIGLAVVLGIDAHVDPGADQWQCPSVLACGCCDELGGAVRMVAWVGSVFRTK
jgi:hypothetical protein